jgi:hypothetical protein
MNFDRLILIETTKIDETNLLIMKEILFRTGCTALVAGLMSCTANAQNLITVDELFPAEGMTHGGDWNGNPLTPHIALDPSGTGLANVLYYDLPAVFQTAQAGDVQITDPWENNTINDVIRFDGQGHLIFYSNGQGSLGGADISSSDFTFILAHPLSNLATANELSTTGGEAPPGLNWVDYTPQAGSGPGYVGGGPPGGSPSYKFISDVPEPASFGLMILGGLLGLCGLLRRKQS